MSKVSTNQQLRIIAAIVHEVAAWDIYADSNDIEDFCGDVLAVLRARLKAIYLGECDEV